MSWKTILGCTLALGLSTAAYPQSLRDVDHVHGTTGGGSYQAVNADRLRRLYDSGQLESALSYLNFDGMKRLANHVGFFDGYTGNSEPALCTAVLVEADKILTNAHCANPQGGAPVVSVYFTLGYYDTAADGTERQFRVRPWPLEIGDVRTLDYAVLELEDPVPGFEPIGFDVRDPIGGEPLVIIGHPAAEPLTLTRGGCQAFAQPIHDNGFQVNHTCDTLPGNSGSIILSGDLRTIVGLHNRAGRRGVNHGISMLELMKESTLIRTAFQTSPPAVPTGDLCTQVTAPEGFRCEMSGSRAILVALEPERGLPPYGIAWEHWLEGEAGAFGSVFRECDVCPEMVVLPAGRYLMGSPSGEAGRASNEGPQRWIEISEPFALGRYEVTFTEWDACHSAGVCGHRPEDKGWGRARRPVMNVSWNDIQDFERWMNGKVSGSPYGLPSESQWEYGARAGTSTRYWFGDEIDASLARFRGSGSTIEVGSFAPNSFGLYDVHGNVWEWVEDCWSNDLSGTPSDGASRPSKHCDEALGGEARVLRGGSWFDGPRDLRSAGRDWNWPADRFSYDGFRLSRTLTR